MYRNPPMPNRTPYPSDLTDEQWSWIEDLIPVPFERATFQQVRYNRLDIVNGIMYRLRTGCQWRNLPHDLPRWQSVYHYFYIWRGASLLDSILDRLRTAVRATEGRGPEPTLAMIDSQSVKTRDVAVLADRGFDAGKKVKGRKRHILVDASGILLAVLVTIASVQDREGAVRLIQTAHVRHPSITKILVDGAYNGKAIDQAMAETGIDVEVAKRNEQVRGFCPVRLRWKVERAFAWIGRYRCTSKDYERQCITQEAIVKWATIGTLMRRLAPSGSVDTIAHHYSAKSGATQPC